MAKPIQAADFREKSDEELKDLVKSAKTQLFQARFENYTNRLNDTAKVGKLRRELARLETVLSERRHSKQAAAAKGEG
jgi:large subunit ribosomal protein L29